jgi:hypothetical protein
MNNLFENLNNEKFIKNLFFELSKLPFGSLPKTELELVILHSIIEAHGGYEKLNEISPQLQRSLRLSQTKFKNKVLEAQLRFDQTEIEPKQFIKEIILKKDFSEIIFHEKYLIIYISNPLHLDIIKTFFDSSEILNDTSFNKNVLKIHTKGLLKILTKVLDENQLKILECELRKNTELNKKTFSLIENINIESIFSANIDPFQTIDKFISYVRSCLAIKK